MIINADDFGISQMTNRAITECFKKGVINRTTIMVNMPFYEQAVALAKENDFFHLVGIHLNIDSGIPLTEKIKNNKNFCNTQGVFNGSFKKKPLHAFFMSKYDKHCLEEEIEAQFIKYTDSGFSLMHFDSHHHNHVRYSVLKLIIPIAKRLGFISCRLSRNLYITKPSLVKRVYKFAINRMIKKNFNTSVYFGSHSEWLANKVKRQIEKTEVMVHPAYVDRRLVDIVGQNRIGEIDMYDFKVGTKS